MVQVHLEACLPDVRVAPVKMMGASQQSPARRSGDGGGLYKSAKNFGRSRSVRGEASEEDVYEAEFGGPAERGGSRASSRSKSRIAKDARAELLGLEDAVHNVVRSRELRSRSAARVREGVDIEMDVAEDEGAHMEVSKSRSSSRMRGRSLKEKSDVAVLPEALHDSGVARSVSGSRTLKNGADAPEIDERLYTGRSLQSTPRPLSRAATPRSSLRASRDLEESRAPPEVPVGEELRSRRSLLNSLDPEGDAAPEQRERISYRIPTKSPRSARETSDLPEERLLRVERLTRKPGRSPRKTIGEATDMQVEPVVAQALRAPRRNVRKADLDGAEDEEDVTGLHSRGRVARQPKRKVRDIPRDPAAMLPVSQPPECEMVDVVPLEPADPFLLPSSPTSSSRSSRG